MVGTQITKEHLYSRAAWCAEVSKLDLVLLEEAWGWCLYRDMGHGKLRQVAASDTKQNTFRILQGIYEVLLSMQELKGKEALLKDQ
jgi:hypothetical protein